MFLSILKCFFLHSNRHQCSEGRKTSKASVGGVWTDHAKYMRTVREGRELCCKPDWKSQTVSCDELENL